MCVLPSTLNWEILGGQRFVFFVFWTPSIHKSGLAHNTYWPIPDGDAKPKQEGVICSYATSLELTVQILKKLSVWWVLGGQIKEQTQSLCLTVSSQCPWWTKTNIQKLFGNYTYFQASWWSELKVGITLKKKYSEPSGAILLTLWSSFCPYLVHSFGERELFAFRTLKYQDQYCFLFSFPLGCQKYPGKVSDSYISLSESGLSLETSV